MCYSNKPLHDELLNLKSANVVKHGDKLVIGEELPGSAKSYAFSSGKGTNVIYNSELVAWITAKFKLDYSNGRTSRNFQNIKIVRPENAKPYAVIEMTK